MHVVINYTLLYATKIINPALRASLKKGAGRLTKFVTDSLCIKSCFFRLWQHEGCRGTKHSRHHYQHHD